MSTLLNEYREMIDAIDQRLSTYLAIRHVLSRSAAILRGGVFGSRDGDREAQVLDNVRQTTRGICVDPDESGIMDVYEILFENATESRTWENGSPRYKRSEKEEGA